MTRTVLTLSLIAFLATGCVSTRSQHGYVVELGETEVDGMPGIDTKESVLARFGEPSVRPPLEDDTWYYISQKTNARAFFQTEVYERTIVAFNFDEDGTVTEIDRYSLDDGTNVDIVGRKTATRGKELNFFEQLLGGVGVAAGQAPANAPNAPPQ